MKLLQGRRSAVRRIAAVAVLSLLATGCVRRTLKISTDPQGAKIVLNDQHVGTSPLSVDFVWYGDYSVIATKEGYETLNTHKRIHAPWYQVPPFDFLAEVFVPFRIHDVKEMCFQLEPAQPIDRDVLLQQSKEFRDRALFEGGDQAQGGDQVPRMATTTTTTPSP